MSRAPHPFRRILLDLPGRAADAGTIRAVAELAGALDAELNAMFVEDEDLLALAGLPFVRELRLPEHAWHPMVPDRIAQDMRQAVAQARRMLADAAAAAGIHSRLEVLRGEASRRPVGNDPDDIVVVCEPARSGERTLGTFARRRHAAYHSVAAVMFMPPGGAPARGAVAALVGSADDPALATAARVALRLDASLVVLAPEGVNVAEAAAGLGITPARLLPRPLHGRSTAAIAATLAPTPTRLLVLTRETVLGDGEEALSRLAAAAGLAVLAVEPSS